MFICLLLQISISIVSYARKVVHCPLIQRCPCVPYIYYPLGVTGIEVSKEYKDYHSLQAVEGKRLDREVKNSGDWRKLKKRHL